MGEPVACPWCEGGSWRSDWAPYCSAGCEYLAALAQARAEGAAAERAKIAAEIAALATEPDYGGLALAPRLSPATAAALRDVARRVASGGRD